MMNIINSRSLTNVQVVLLALLKLGGEQSDVDTEDVAVCANDISPGRFVWRKFTDRISLEDVRIALKDAKRLAFVSGGTKRGWHLTKDGADWARDNKDSGGSGADPAARPARNVLRRQGLERTRIFELEAWKKFSVGEDVSRREASAVFRLTDYVDPHRRSLMVERMRSLMGGDKVLGKFIEAMAAIVTTPQKEHREENA